MKIQSVCPVCGRWPRLDPWYVNVGKMMVIELSLVCKDGTHECTTSYSEDCEKVVTDWERLVASKTCKFPGGRA